MVLQNVPQLQLAAGRREPADGGRAQPGPQLRYARAKRRALNCSGRSCRAVTLKEMKTLRAHRWWATWSGVSRCPWTSRTVRPHVHHKPLLPGRLCAVQQEPQPTASAAHSPEGDSRGRLPHFAEATEDVRLARSSKERRLIGT